MINQKSLDLIKSFEGLELKAYRDPVGIWTIGYGHTDMAGPPKVTAGLRITPKEAEELLKKDLVKYENSVKKYVKVPLNDNQYGALVSFTYNLGAGNLAKSTLLKKVNRKDFAGAAKEFAKWNKAGGKVLKGLVRRRAAEAALFSTPSSATQTPVQPPVDVPVTSTPKDTKKPSVGFLGAIMNLLKSIFGAK